MGGLLTLIYSGIDRFLLRELSLELSEVDALQNNFNSQLKLGRYYSDSLPNVEFLQILFILFHFLAYFLEE